MFNLFGLHDFNREFKAVNSFIQYRGLGRNKMTGWILNKINQFSTPTVEVGALNLVNAAFNRFGFSIPDSSSITKFDIIEGDKTEIGVHCRSKKISIKDNLAFEKALVFINDFEVEDKTPTSLAEALDSLPKNTSSCYPLYVKKSSSKAINHVSSSLLNISKMDSANEVYNYLASHPTTVFHRYTPKMKSNFETKSYENKFKIRQIFGVPFFICALEYMIFSKWVKEFKSRFKYFHTIGLTKVEVSRAVQILRSRAKSNDSFIMCGDISGCDKSIPLISIKMFFASIFSKIGHSNTSLSVAKYFGITPILNLDGEIKYSRGGNPSGSWLTTILNTWYVLLVLTYSYVRMYSRLPSPGDILVQGDDFLILIKSKHDADFIKATALEMNLRVKSSERHLCTCTGEIEFLGYLWDQVGEPDQSDDWIISRIIFPEKYVKFNGHDRIASRYLSLLFQLKRFRNLFFRFFEFDRHLRHKVRSSKEPTFNLIDNSGNVTIQVLPLKKFLDVGWRMF